MSTSIAEINRIVRTRPTELKYLFKSPTEDKKRLTRLISQLVPYRVGIEFETFGAVGEHLFPNECITRLHERKSVDKEREVDELIRKRLKLVAFREDNHVDPPINVVYPGDDRDMNEVRISISGYKQLITLWNALQILNKCLIIPKENGGIHIHIDAPFVRESKGSEFALKWFDRPAILSEVLQIFEGYSGTYNKRHASKNKANYIRITDYPTIEFRIGRLSYDYPTLIRYIIKCSELVRKCRKEYEKLPKQKSLNQETLNQSPGMYSVTINNNGRVVVDNFTNDRLCTPDGDLDHPREPHDPTDSINEYHQNVWSRSDSNYTSYRILHDNDGNFYYFN